MASSEVRLAVLAHQFLQAFPSSMGFDLPLIEMGTSVRALRILSAK